MTILAFPPLESANEHGLLAAGGDLEPDSLLLAYRLGVFPWPLGGEQDMLWFSPPKRAVLYLENFHLSRSMGKVLAKTPFKFALNKDCEGVITGCQAVTNRPRQHGTWITHEMKEAYLELHRQGFVHSLECYLENRLVGGLYGVSIGTAFAAESMFYRHPNASKAVLWILAQYLSLQGATWIDCQIINPHLKSLGAIEIPRGEFINQHEKMTKKPPIEFTPERLGDLLSSLEVLQKPGLSRLEQ